MSETLPKHTSLSATEADPVGMPAGPPPLIDVVDDDPATVEAVVHFLRGRGYEVRGFTDPHLAEVAFRARHPHLLIADRAMPGIGGFDLARRALEEDPDIAVVILTGAQDIKLAIEAFRLGASDYLLKPLDFREIERTVHRVLLRRSQAIFHRETEARMRAELEVRTRELTEKNRLLEEVTVGSLAALVAALEERNPHFRGHSEAVARLSAGIARTLELPAAEVEACRTAGFLHDIGMIAVPDRILEKSEQLSPEESARVRDHCRIGRDVLRPFAHLGPVPEYVYLHHERADGSGYPEGRRLREIPLGAQIVAVADSYQALVEPRPYRAAYPPREAVDTLMGTAGIWHAPEVLRALVRVLPLSRS